VSDTVGIILTIALIVDACANVARLVSVEIAYKRQEALMRRSELEHEKRVEAAIDVVAAIAEAVSDPARQAKAEGK
jgi:hypothetical protein